MLVRGGGMASCGAATYGDVMWPMSGQYHMIASNLVGSGKTPGGPEDYLATA